jgi:uncharacterized protein (TIGR02246 family)
MPAARESIEQVYREMERAFLRGDAEGVASIYTADAEWMVPGAPPIKGREAITQAWKAVIGPGGNRVRVDVGEVQEAGDWAYEVGTFKTTGPDGVLLNSGKYIVIWQRQPAGDWKTHRDIFHWDVAPAQV